MAQLEHKAIKFWFTPTLGGKQPNHTNQHAGHTIGVLGMSASGDAL